MIDQLIALGLLLLLVAQVWILMEGRDIRVRQRALIARQERAVEAIEDWMRKHAS